MATSKPTFTTPQSDRVHFPGLNTVRFLAAMAVMVHHVEQFKFDAHLNSLWPTPLILGLGPSGVALFFVLSGFLITFLLLVEREKTGSISIKGFYIRRILRIWPLYYLIVVWAFFLLPRILDPHVENVDGLRDHFYHKLLLFLVILPNLALFRYFPVTGGAQAWSIGVEEQFYLVWPHVIKRFTKNLLLFFILIIVAKLMLVKGMYLLLEHGNQLRLSDRVLGRLNLATNAFTYFQIENMTVGGIAAYLYYHGRVQRLRMLLHPFTIAVNFALLIFFVGYRNFFLHGIIEAVVFSVLITQIVCRPEWWSKWESGTLRYLGNISYGVYMFHATVIAVSLTYLLKFPAITSSRPILNVLIYGFAITFTLLISAASYLYFESPFLRLKRKFAIIKSGGA